MLRRRAKNSLSIPVQNRKGTTTFVEAILKHSMVQVRLTDMPALGKAKLRSPKGFLEASVLLVRRESITDD